MADDEPDRRRTNRPTLRLPRRTGTTIVAAGNGLVIDAGPASGYGLWIRLQHPDATITAYGHNNRNLVHTGQTVRAG